MRKVSVDLLPITLSSSDSNIGEQVQLAKESSVQWP